LKTFLIIEPFFSRMLQLMLSTQIQLQNTLLKEMSAACAAAAIQAEVVRSARAKARAND
jgi:hypothetical protein